MEHTRIGGRLLYQTVFLPAICESAAIRLSHDNLVAEQGVQLNAYREMLDNFVHMQSIEDESVSDN